jgi:hypothetical protein
MGGRPRRSASSAGSPCLHRLDHRAELGDRAVGRARAPVTSISICAVIVVEERHLLLGDVDLRDETRRSWLPASNVAGAP